MYGSASPATGTLSARCRPESFRCRLDNDLAAKLKANGVSVFSLPFTHVRRLEEIPQRHCEPFDLIAQTMEENIPLVTADTAFKNYAVRVI
jgi:PIN domain nuclease of toxin-antitoxin system